MNTKSASPANAPVGADTNASPTEKVLVWDAPVRLFHWLMVLCFAGAYITAESETWRLLHVTLGYTMVGLVAFRLVWGVAGTRYARFAAFVRGPRAVLTYVRSLLGGQPQHYTGHNPAGAVAIVLMLGLTIAIGATGWATYNDIAGDWAEELHEAVANAMLIVIGIHIAGGVVASALHQENLVRAMVTGHKYGTPQDAIRSAWRVVAALMLVGVVGFWVLQWNSAPDNAGAQGSAVSERNDNKNDHDDD